MSDVTSLPVEFLFRMELDLGPYAVIPNGPHGTRILAPVLGGTVVGPRITAAVAPGADWATVRADGSAQLDVRLVLTTDDGAVITMEYRGVLLADLGPRSAPLFQASAEAYRWLNHVQAIGVGQAREGGVVYDVYGLQ